MGKKVEESQKMLQEMFSKPSDAKSVTPQQGQTEHNDIANFFQHTSVYGAVIVYGCYLSYTKNLPFDVRKWPQGPTTTDRSYVWGFIIGLHSVDILHLKETKEEKIYVVSKFSPTLAQDIKGKVLRKVNAAAAAATDAAYKADLPKTIEAIEAFFGGSA